MTAAVVADWSAVLAVPAIVALCLLAMVVLVALPERRNR